MELLELVLVIINVLDKLLYNIRHKMIMTIRNYNNNKIQQMVNIMKYNKEIFNNNYNYKNNKNMEIDIRNIPVQ